MIDYVMGTDPDTALLPTGKNLCDSSVPDCGQHCKHKMCHRRIFRLAESGGPGIWA